MNGRLEVDAHRGLDGLVLTAGVTGGETVAHAEVEVLVGGHVADLEVAHEVARNVVVERVGRGGAFKRVGRFRVAEAAAERDVHIGLDLEGLEHEGRGLDRHADGHFEDRGFVFGHVEELRGAGSDFIVVHVDDRDAGAGVRRQREGARLELAFGTDAGGEGLGLEFGGELEVAELHRHVAVGRHVGERADDVRLTVHAGAPEVQADVLDIGRDGEDVSFAVGFTRLVGSGGTDRPAVLQMGVETAHDAVGVKGVAVRGAAHGEVVRLEAGAHRLDPPAAHFLGHRGGMMLDHVGRVAQEVNRHGLDAGDGAEPRHGVDHAADLLE